MVSANFAVEMRHLHFGIAGPGGGAFGHCILDSAQVFACKLDVECAQRFAQPVAASRTNHRYDVLALRRDPGNGDLRHRHALAGRDPLQRLDQREVLVDIVALKPRAVRAVIFWIRVPFFQCPLMRPRESTP